jgi:hypothetical protein
VRDRLTNKGKGIGFVLFSSKEAARAALNMHGSKLKEREVRVMRIGQTGAVRLPNEDKGGGYKGKTDKSVSGGGGGFKGSMKGDKGSKIASGFKAPTSFIKGASKGGGAVGDAWRGTKSKKADSEEMMKKLGVKKGGVAGGIKKKSSEFGGKPKASGPVAGATGESGRGRVVGGPTERRAGDSVCR